MKIANIAACVVVSLICCDFGVAQHPAVMRHHPVEPYANIHAGFHPAEPHANFHAGVHSGSWTLKREQLLAEESKDMYRSCPDPYCARCAKHLADYGHEYQYVGGPSQRQLWYWGTAGSVAHVTQRGYDQRGLPYFRRGQPAAVMSWEYVQTLNHAIWEQVVARNAVAAEEVAQDRIILLTQLLIDAKEQLRLTEIAWKQIEPLGACCHEVETVAVVATASGRCCKKTYKQFCVDMRAGQYEVAQEGLCIYCLAEARYQFDLTYVADVECELALAYTDLAHKNMVATEAVRIALLSKEDADKATRFKRFQYKPPKAREVLAAMNVPDAEPPAENGEETEEVTP